MARMSGGQFDRRIRGSYRKRFGRMAPSPGGATRLSTARIAEISDLAEAVANEHFHTNNKNNNSNIKRTEPVQIARSKAITLSFNDYGDSFDGMLEHCAGRFHIYCNSTRVGQMDSQRARFTLAHELGHYYLDDHRNALAAGRAAAHRSLCGWQSQNMAEQEADHFAASLLMPREKFCRAIRIVPRSLDGILQLADEFGSSLTATALRWSEMDLMPCAVIKWDHKGYAWKKLSSSAFQDRYRHTVEIPDKLIPGSPTARLLAGEKPENNNYFSAATVASAWFSGLGQGDSRDIILTEQAISLGRFGFLTILYPAAGV